MLDFWSEHDEIFIDGQNGLGKSTLVRNLKRHSIKINEFVPHITKGPTYNTSPERAVEYFFLPLKIQVLDAVCWDRCHFSNAIFYMIHYLMAYYEHSTIPMDDLPSIYAILNTAAESLFFIKIAELAAHFKKAKILFYTCSDIALVCTSLLKRGIETNSPNDITNAKEINYQIAQYIVYTWFAKLIKSPCIDMALFAKVGYTFSDVHTIVASIIDRKPIHAERKIILPDLSNSRELHEISQELHFGDHTLLYDMSKK